MLVQPTINFRKQEMTAWTATLVVETINNFIIAAFVLIVFLLFKQPAVGCV